MKYIQVESIRQIPWLLTMDPHAESTVGIIENAAVMINEGRIAWVGRDSECPLARDKGHRFDATGLVGMPALIDCHTHLVFGGDRVQDFYDRARGTSYAEIMSRGGGIQHTVAQTRMADRSALIDEAMASLRRMLLRGVTTVEVKSGYGLNLDDEIKILEIVEALNGLQPITLSPTFLGAHAVPAEFKGRSSDYVELLINEVLPQVARRKLASAVDVFVEGGAFSVDEGRKLLTKARELGFQVKVHADQLSASGGTGLAAEMKALSASHLEHAKEEDLKALGRAGVIAEILPIAEVYLGFDHLVNVQRLIDLGVRVAIATDFNPGSSMCDDLQLAMRLAVTQRKMRVEDAYKGVTYHAACALGQQQFRGQIKVGMKADLCFFEGRSPWSLAYDWTSNPVRHVIKGGVLVV